jgi:hypothetical protein
MYATGRLRVRYRYATPLGYPPIVGEVFYLHPGVILSVSFKDLPFIKKCFSCFFPKLFSNEALMILNFVDNMLQEPSEVIDDS